MRLRRAVPKIPAKSSVPPGLPLDKNRSLLSHSESTLPQLLIPLHFKSRISNTYKKPHGEGPISTLKVLQLATNRTRFLRARTNPRNPNPLYALLHNSCTPRGWGAPYRSGSAIRGCRPSGSGSRVKGHALKDPQVPLRRNPQSARITGVSAWCSPGNISAPAVSKILRADIGFGIRRLPNPVARRLQKAERGSHSQEGLGPTF
jgi:hypothetical protein